MELAAQAGCKVEKCLLSYLGLPLLKFHRVWESSETIKENKNLMGGGKVGCQGKVILNLTQPVLSTLPSYFLSIFRLQVIVKNELEKSMRKKGRLLFWDRGNLKENIKIQGHLTLASMEMELEIVE